MKRKRRTQAERREATREEVLSAAGRVFAKRGFHATSLEAIADEAGLSRGAVYYNIDTSLSRWPVALLYIVANIALGIHLFHGTWSLFQSMGWNNPRFNAWRRGFATGFAALIVIGNVSFPIAVTAGIVSV